MNVLQFVSNSHPTLVLFWMWLLHSERNIEAIHQGGRGLAHSETALTFKEEFKLLLSPHNKC